MWNGRNTMKFYHKGLLWVSISRTQKPISLPFNWRRAVEWLSALQGFDLHDPVFEFLIGDDGFVLDLCFVGIDGIDGVFQDTRYFFVFMNAHPYQGEDPEIGIEEFVVFQLYLVFFPEEGVEPLYEVGEKF